jgi:hypothetical protein
MGWWVRCGGCCGPSPSLLVISLVFIIVEKPKDAPNRVLTRLFRIAVVIDIAAAEWRASHGGGCGCGSCSSDRMVVNQIAEGSGGGGGGGDHAVVIIVVVVAAAASASTTNLHGRAQQRRLQGPTGGGRRIRRDKHRDHHAPHGEAQKRFKSEPSKGHVGDSTVGLLFGRGSCEMQDDNAGGAVGGGRTSQHRIVAIASQPLHVFSPVNKIWCSLYGLDGKWLVGLVV